MLVLAISICSSLLWGLDRKFKPSRHFMLKKRPNLLRFLSLVTKWELSKHLKFKWESIQILVGNLTPNVPQKHKDPMNLWWIKRMETPIYQDLFNSSHKFRLNYHQINNLWSRISRQVHRRLWDTQRFLKMSNKFWERVKVWIQFLKRWSLRRRERPLQPHLHITFKISTKGPFKLLDIKLQPYEK